MELSTEIILFLALTAFIAGFIDSIAGGGGLLSLPALLLAGVPPISALGTNKLQALFGSTSAAISYARGGHLNWRAMLPLFLISLIGSAIGAYIATRLPTDLLKLVMPIALIGIAVFFALKPNLDDKPRPAVMAAMLFNATMIPLIGFYDGIFGPGTGSFFMIAYVGLLGLGVLDATARTKVVNSASNLGGFLTLAIAGSVLWKVGLMMGVCQMTGAIIGSRLAMKKGSRLIKPLLIVVCIAMALRLLMS